MLSYSHRWEYTVKLSTAECAMWMQIPGPEVKMVTILMHLHSITIKLALRHNAFAPHLH